MKIITNNRQPYVDEDYSSIEEDDVVTILSKVCEQIDALKLASIECFFSDKDSSFLNLDFSYDFNSIAVELQELSSWIEAGEEREYVLYFYTFHRKVFFLHVDKKHINYTITNELKSEVVSRNNLIKRSVLQATIDTMIKDFSLLVKSYFPKATNIFIKEEFIL